MADPTLPPLPPGFTLDSAPVDRPVIRRGPAPTPPTPPTEEYHPITPQERQSYGLPANVPAAVSGSGKPDVISLPASADKTSWRMLTPVDPEYLPDRPGFKADTGDVKYGPAGTKAAAPVDKATAQAHISDLLHTIDHASSMLDNPLASGLPGSLLGHVPGTDAYTLRSFIGDPSDPQNPGQISGDLRQQGIAYLRALNGGNGVGTVARSQQEQAALQSAMSNIRQGLPPAELKSALGNVKQIYLRAYASSFGLDPTDPAVQKQFGIDANYQLPGGNPAETAVPQAQVPAQVPGQSPEHITASNAPPAIGVNGGQATGVSSGDTKAVTDPAMAAIAPQLEKYLAADPSKVTNAMILGFMQKNGVDPANTSVMGALQYRTSKDGALWRSKGGSYAVSPTYNVPLTGAEKVGAEISGSPGGAFALGAADTATGGLLPDVVGSLPGMTRTEVVNARDAAAGAHPLATVLGNLAGGFSPLPGGAAEGAIVRAAKTGGQGALYGFAGSDNPDIRARLVNAAEGGAVGLVTHGVADVGLRSAEAAARPVGKAVNGIINGSETAADDAALGAAARRMPVQDMNAARSADIASEKAGVQAPAAASIDRAGQDYLARVAQGSPQSRAVADGAAEELRKSLPQGLAGDFNAAIQSASSNDTSAFLNRPVRDIANDVQDMAGREYERGIAPIAKSPLSVTPELADALTHERASGAIRDALSNHNLDPDTRNVLRGLPAQLKALDGLSISTSIGTDSEAVAKVQSQVRDKYAAGIPLTVDAARNVATALDRTAAKLQDGSEAAVNMHQLSGQIRNAIGEQFPEYGPVNQRYSSRMRAIDAMDSARRGFFASTPDNIDALNKASGNYTDTPNEPEYGVAPAQTGKNGFTISTGATPLPSNRQFAGAGAREAATVKAGENGSATPNRIANNVNQQDNNAVVLGDDAAAQVQVRAAARAKSAEAVERVSSGASTDRTQAWFDVAKRAAVLKLTGGTHSGQYMLAHAAASVPGLSGQDAARVVRLYLDNNSAQRVFQSLESSYGQRRARFIMARMAAVTSSATAVRGFHKQPDK